MKTRFKLALILFFTSLFGMFITLLLVVTNNIVNRNNIGYIATCCLITFLISLILSKNKDE